MGKCDELIQECTQMIAEEGLKSFSLRKLADRVGIKAPSIYEHFDSKECLIDKARQAAITQLGDAMRSHCAGDTPRQRLITTAMGYLEFAEKQPSLFALLFMEMPSKRLGLEDAPKADSPYAVLLARVQELIGGQKQDAETLSFGIWSLLHGVAVLRQTHLKDFPAPLTEGARINLEALINGWGVL